MKFRQFMGEDFMGMAPIGTDGAFQYWKAATIGLIGTLWGNFVSYYQLLMQNTVLHIVWVLFVMDMITGMAASFKSGLRDEKGQFVYQKTKDINGNIIYPLDDAGNRLKVVGFAAWSGKKAIQGISRLLWLYCPLVWASGQVRTHGNPISNAAAGTVESYVILIIFISIWKNLSRANGDTRGENAANMADERFTPETPGGNRIEVIPSSQQLTKSEKEGK